VKHWLSIANWSSLSFPRKLEFGQIQGQPQSRMAVLIAFAAQILLFAISSLVLGVGRWTGDRWLPARETWDRLVHQGVHLLHRFAQDDRVRIHDPRKDLQIKFLQTLTGGSQFVAYLDAIGEIDGVRCLIDWKTTTSRYREGPEGLLSLDPQLICYSWITGIPEVALVVFVRKQAPEIQYLRVTISEEQRQEFGRLVQTTTNQIEAGHFDSHSGIRFPQNGCVSCPHLGLCLNNEQLVAAKLIRKPGASELDWLDELVD
jgi:hypothetical protein